MSRSAVAEDTLVSFTNFEDISFPSSHPAAGWSRRAYPVFVTAV